MVCAQVGWAQQSQPVWEVVGAEKLCYGPQAQAPGQRSLLVWSGAVWVVGWQGSGAARPWAGEGEPSRQWGPISAPYPGGMGAEWRNSPSSALTTIQTPEWRVALVYPTHFLQSREDRQSSLGRAGPLQDLVPALSLKEYHRLPTEALPPLPCASRAAVAALTGLHCNYTHKCLYSPVDHKFHEAERHPKI